MSAFGRRCGWCGIALRWWQINLCGLCRPRATGDAGVYLRSGGPPCREGSRWDVDPRTGDGTSCRLQRLPETPA